MVVLGLGANLGNPAKTISTAIDELRSSFFKGCSGMLVSSFYRSEAMLLEGSPKGWNLGFLNICIAGECKYTNPFKALQHTQSIEASAGVRSSHKWAPRSLDIDILYFGSLVVSSVQAAIPHPGIRSRSFVLMPLHEILPKRVHPLYALDTTQMLEEMRASQIDTLSCVKLNKSQITQQKYEPKVWHCRSAKRG